MDERTATPRRESLAIFALFLVAYTVVGYRIVIEGHVVSFEALDRLSRTTMVWYDDPARLSSIGFSLPPVPSLVMLPFAGFRDLTSSGLAIPLSSAVGAAGTLVYLNRLLTTIELGRAPRFALVVLIAVNPMFAFYAINGSGDAAGLLGASVGLFCVVAWWRVGSPRYLLGAGVALALSALSNYQFIAWALAIALLITITLRARETSRAEVSGSIIAFLAPVGYGLALWVLLSWIIVGDPLEWASLDSSAATPNVVSPSTVDFALGKALIDSLRVQLVFPLALIALPLLLLRGSSRENRPALGLALLILSTILYPLIGAAIADDGGAIELRSGLPAIVAGTAGMAWIYLRTIRSRAIIGGVLLAAAAISVPIAWEQMRSYPHQNLEQAFTRAISSGDDQEGMASLGGHRVGIGAEQSMASYIRAQSYGNNQILTDEARTFGVIALSGEPELFLDRTDNSEDAWLAAVVAPRESVALMLIERSDEDLIRSTYPGADSGEVPFLRTVVANDRYALIEVLEDSSGAAGNTSGP